MAGVSAADQARQVLGARLRELRKDARLDGRQFSTAAGWHWSKTSRIEHGKQSPSEDDVAVWCRVCDAELALPDLIAALRNVEAQWAEWKRITATGHARRQRRGVELEGRTRLLRVYTVVLLPGLLQTEDYARAVLTQCIRFLGTHDDLTDAVAARMERQQVLHRGNHRIATLVHESALHTVVGDPRVMADQLRRLLDVAFDNPRLIFGVVPLDAEFIYTTTSFDMFDQRMALVETISAELTVTRPSELRYYEQAWAGLHRQARYGEQAKEIVRGALARWTRRISGT
ncbi:XRE family transcriptional regulator [Nocardia panacis]|uniref:XRE family transcriptional regulator n=1 Tax=Nocardia panacis TaxID=2340916 RepID=A0A3A4KMP6_9NOCA|nr:helix-turn-helix transcriptional regulator [Nocardia panacis]RJO78407.1 XRE family transcriptional regulator [Nocardia panacis]